MDNKKATAIVLTFLIAFVILISYSRIFSILVLLFLIALLMRWTLEKERRR